MRLSINGGTPFNPRFSWDLPWNKQSSDHGGPLLFRKAPYDWWILVPNPATKELTKICIPVLPGRCSGAMPSTSMQTCAFRQSVAGFSGAPFFKMEETPLVNFSLSCIVSISMYNTYHPWANHQFNHQILSYLTLHPAFMVLSPIQHPVLPLTAS